MSIKNYLNIIDKSGLKKYYIIFGIIFLFVIFVATQKINIVSAATGINQQIPYSGSIVNNAGIVLPDNTYRAKFVLWQWDGVTIGVNETQVYEEIRDGITVYPGTGVSPALSINDGRFDILLGSQNATLSSILNNDSLYLEIQLDMDNNGSYEEVFRPRRRIGSAVSAINALRLVATPGGADTDTLSLDIAGNVIASSLGGSANGAAGLGYDRVLLANSTGQFSQVNISTLGGGSGWGLLGNATADAWNGTTGSFVGTTSAQTLVLATTNATAQDIKFFTGANGANERLSITGAGNIIAPILGGTANATIGSNDRVLLSNSSGQFSQAAVSVFQPGGSNNQLQFKNGTAFAGASNVEIAQGALRLIPQSTPTAPASGVLLYSESLAGSDLPYYMTSSGRKDAVGKAWFGKPVPLEVGVANGTTAPPTLGGSVVTAATLSYQFSANSTNRYTSMARKRYNTASANATTGIRQDYGFAYSGNDVGYGGVFFSTRFGVNANKLSTVFVGLTSSTGALGGNASALTNMIGMGYDLTDPTTGNWFLMKNNGAGTAQRIDLLATNAARAGDIGFELNLYNPPNSTTWFVYITNLNTGAVVLNTSYIADAEVPVVNTGLAMKAEIRNDAVATNANIEHNYIYVEPQGL